MRTPYNQKTYVKIHSLLIYTYTNTLTIIIISIENIANGNVFLFPVFFSKPALKFSLETETEK